MSTPAAIEPVPDATPGLSEPARLVNTFVAPSKTFADIRRNASWWAPYVIGVLFAYLFVFGIQQKIGWDRLAENELAKSPKAQQQLEQAPPDQRERIMGMRTAGMKYTFYAMPVLSILGALIIAGVFLGTFNFGFGAQINFSTMMAIVMYGMLPSIIQSLLTAVSLFAGSDPDGFNPQNPVFTNPAYLMDPTKNKFLYSAVSCFDVIAMWMIFLLATGIALNSKVKRGTAFITILALYVVFKLGAGALGAALS